MPLQPRTKQDDVESKRKERAAAINLIVLHAERLQENFIKRREVDTTLYRKVVNSIYAIGQHFKLTPEHAQAFGAKIEKCAHGDQYMVNVEGTRVYIEGYYDLAKLKQEFLW